MLDVSTVVDVGLKKGDIRKVTEVSAADIMMEWRRANGGELSHQGSKRYKMHLITMPLRMLAKEVT